jgi:hypothetical protein
LVCQEDSGQVSNINMHFMTISGAGAFGFTYIRRAVCKVHISPLFIWGECTMG